LKEATDESDNPDLRNRGYIYWRMLSEDPEQAKKIILCERPSIKLDQNSLDPSLRDSLLQNLSKLSSVFYKLPENFVKKIRERQNQLEEEQEKDVGDLLG
jgi:AP-1 complex subunit beta-1